MHQEGKLDRPKYAGQVAKTRRNMDMNQTRDRIFPDELDTRLDIGNFETSATVQKASRQEKREKRKILENKCKALEDELGEEMVRTQRIQEELTMKKTLGASQAMRTPSSQPSTRPYTPAFSDVGAPALSPTAKVGVPFYQ
eukprot:jgi/Tetstr1/449327/TSEL_003842.t1